MPDEKTNLDNKTEDNPVKSTKDWVYPRQKWSEKLTLACGWLFILFGFAYIFLGVLAITSRIGSLRWTWLDIWFILSTILSGIFSFICASLIFQENYKWSMVSSIIVFLLIITSPLVLTNPNVSKWDYLSITCFIIVPLFILISTYIVYWFNRKGETK